MQYRPRETAAGDADSRLSTRYLAGHAGGKPHSGGECRLAAWSCLLPLLHAKRAIDDGFVILRRPATRVVFARACRRSLASSSRRATRYRDHIVLLCGPVDAGALCRARDLWLADMPAHSAPTPPVWGLPGARRSSNGVSVSNFALDMNLALGQSGKTVFICWRNGPHGYGPNITLRLRVSGRRR